MYFLAQHILGYRRLSPAYPLIFQEQYLFFLLKVVKEGRPCKLDTPSTFLESFFQSDIPNQHLLCGLYLHEVFYFGDRIFNISPYVGDIQLRAFTSFVNNQVWWKVAFDTIKTN